MALSDVPEHPEAPGPGLVSGQVVGHQNYVEALVADADVVMDGTDNFETRYLLNDICVKLGKPWVYTGVVSSYGMTMTVVPGETPCLRCVFEAAPAPGEEDPDDTPSKPERGPVERKRHAGHCKDRRGDQLPGDHHPGTLGFDADSDRSDKPATQDRRLVNAPLAIEKTRNREGHRQWRDARKAPGHLLASRRAGRGRPRGFRSRRRSRATTP